MIVCMIRLWAFRKLTQYHWANRDRGWQQLRSSVFHCSYLCYCLSLPATLYFVHIWILSGQISSVKKIRFIFLIIIHSHSLSPHFPLSLSTPNPYFSLSYPLLPLPNFGDLLFKSLCHKQGMWRWKLEPSSYDS